MAALKIARFYAVLFFWVTMACVLTYITVFVLTEWFGFYDAPPAKPAVAAPVKVEPKPAAPAKSPAGGHSWLGLLESEACAAEAGPEKSGPSFFGMPATTKKSGTTEEAPKAPKAPAASPEEAAAPAPAAPMVPPVIPPPEEEPVTVGKIEGGRVPPPEELKQELTAEQRRERAGERIDSTVNVLRPLRVTGVLCGILLWLTLFLYLQIALLGRLGGIRQLTNAMFLMLLFLISVIPWENYFGGFHVSAFYDFSKLIAAHAERIQGNLGDFWAQGRYYLRFFVWPIISVILLVWSGIQFAGGYSESVVANE
jgi:hypothetical protein